MQKTVTNFKYNADPQPKLYPNAAVLEFGSVSQKAKKLSLDQKYTSPRKRILTSILQTGNGGRTSIENAVCFAATDIFYSGYTIAEGSCR
jgi:hypothetical protein